MCIYLCYRHLSSQLVELEKAIEKMMEADFVHFAVEDILNRFKSSLQEGSARVETEVCSYTFWPYMLHHRLPQQIQLDSVVKGLLRRRKLNFLSALRGELVTVSKTHVKEVSGHVTGR